MEINNRLRATLMCVLIGICSLPLIDAGVGLLMGIGFAVMLGNPWYKKTDAWSKVLLKVSVVGLGFNLNIKNVLTTGGHAVWFTIAAIALTMLVGTFLGRVLGTAKKTSILISTGTAICGGSAIAAMGPAIRAKGHHMAVALATVFVLNGVALLTFPMLGRLIGLTNGDFGVWAAMAIHDTSSVAGAAVAYGQDSVEIGLTVKLTRALWILPLTFVVSYLQRGKTKTPFPMFLVGFLFASTLSTTFPEGEIYWGFLSSTSKQLLSVTLFLVGVGMTRELLRKVGVRPLIQASLLWLFISIVSLLAIYLKWVPSLG